jgi:hypothetical protein
MAMGLPLLAEQFQGALGQRDVAIPVAFALTDVEEHAPGIDVAHLQPQPFSQTQPAGIDGGQANVVLAELADTSEVGLFGAGTDG